MYYLNISLPADKKRPYQNRGIEIIKLYQVLFQEFDFVIFVRFDMLL